MIWSISRDLKLVSADGHSCSVYDELLLCKHTPIENMDGHLIVEDPIVKQILLYLEKGWLDTMPLHQFLDGLNNITEAQQ